MKSFETFKNKTVFGVDVGTIPVIGLAVTTKIAPKKGFVELSLNFEN